MDERRAGWEGKLSGDPGEVFDWRASRLREAPPSFSACKEFSLSWILVIPLTTLLRMLLGVAYLSKAYLISNFLFERGAPVAADIRHWPA